MHILWILVVAYLCGVLTVPLITTSARIGRAPSQQAAAARAGYSSLRGEGDAVPDLEQDFKVAAAAEAAELSTTTREEEQPELLESSSSSASSNPTRRRPKGKRSSSSSGSSRWEAEPHLAQVLQRPPVPDFYHFSNGGACEDTVTDPRAFLIDKLFDGASPYADFPPSWARAHLQESNARGWGSRNRVFERLVSEVRPRVVIELGAFLGASAIHMANLTARLGLRGTTILAVDDFRGWPGFRAANPRLRLRQLHADVLLLHQFMQNVAAEGFQDVILPVPFATSSALTALCRWGVKADLIEVDAGHDFHSAWIDINQAYRVLRPGGVMFGHDYFNKMDGQGVHRAVDLFARTHNFTVEPDQQHWILRGTP